MTAVSYPVSYSIILNLAGGLIGLHLDIPGLVVLDYLLDTVCKELEISR